jgi:hypothetical protein
MTWGQEILRALLLALGFTAITTNLLHLTRENGLELARKQHGELPKSLPDKNIKIKVICMLMFGIAIFASSLLCFILHRYLRSMILVPLILFSMYGIIEALYYRYWKTTGFACVTIVLLIVALLN